MPQKASELNHLRLRANKGCKVTKTVVSRLCPRTNRSAKTHDFSSVCGHFGLFGHPVRCNNVWKGQTCIKKGATGTKDAAKGPAGDQARPCALGRHPRLTGEVATATLPRTAAPQAHEVKQEGLRVSKSARVITVFTSSMYCGGSNGAAAVFLVHTPSPLPCLPAHCRLVLGNPSPALHSPSFTASPVPPPLQAHCIQQAHAREQSGCPIGEVGRDACTGGQSTRDSRGCRGSRGPHAGVVERSAFLSALRMDCSLREQATPQQATGGGSGGGDQTFRMSTISMPPLRSICSGPWCETIRPTKFRTPLPTGVGQWALEVVQSGSWRASRGQATPAPKHRKRCHPLAANTDGVQPVSYATQPANGMSWAVEAPVCGLPRGCSRPFLSRGSGQLASHCPHRCQPCWWPTPMLRSGTLAMTNEVHSECSAPLGVT